jgi:5,10-methylenetetrahydromethanopterin reductase
MKFSLRLNNDHPVADYVAYARIAESAGFDQFWVSNDLFFRSAPVILSAVALATTSIEIGTCILNPYSINPAEIAMMAATLDELSGGRFNLGLSSGAGDFLGWIGIETPQPRTAVIESVSVINTLLFGEHASCDGQFLHWLDEAYLRFQPLRRVPIYLGAMSPKMLAEIGRIADGGLPLVFSPEHYRNVLGYIQDGAKSVGRDLSNVDVAACVWCSISDDKLAAEDALKEKIAYYGHALSPTILEQLDLTHQDFTAIEHAVMAENDTQKAKSLVTEPMMRIGIAGTASDLITRLESLVTMGVNHISLGPPIGPDIAASIETIGRDVIPHFRSQAS